MQILRRGLPSVVLVTERFTALARATMLGNGVSNAPMVVIPGNPEWLAADEVRTAASHVAEEIARALTRSAVQMAELPSA